MNIDISGCHLYLQRLPLETDAQLLERKRFVLRGIVGEAFADEKKYVETLRLGKFFHYKKFKNVTYPAEIERKIN